MITLNNIEKIFRDCDTEPYVRVVGNELRITKLMVIGVITKIKNLNTKEVRYDIYIIES